MNHSFPSRPGHDAAPCSVWQAFEGLTRLVPDVAVLLDDPDLHAAGALDQGLLALLDLRASQVRGCLPCVRQQIGRASEAGLCTTKITGVAAWRDSGAFASRERAALAWAEHLAGADPRSRPEEAWGGLQGHFSDAQVFALFIYWYCSDLWSDDDAWQCRTAGAAVAADAAPDGRESGLP